MKKILLMSVLLYIINTLPVWGQAKMLTLDSIFTLKTPSEPQQELLIKKEVRENIKDFGIDSILTKYLFLFNLPQGIKLKSYFEGAKDCSIYPKSVQCSKSYDIWFNGYWFDRDQFHFRINETDNSITKISLYNEYVHHSKIACTSIPDALSKTIPNLNHLPRVPIISEEFAIKAALDNIRYHSKIDFLKNVPNAEEMGKMRAYIYSRDSPQPLLYVQDSIGKTYFAYQVHINTSFPISAWNVFIDATTGNYIKKRMTSVYLNDCDPDLNSIKTISANILFYSNNANVNVGYCNYGTCENYVLGNDQEPTIKPVQYYFNNYSYTPMPPESIFARKLIFTNNGIETAPAINALLTPPSNIGLSDGNIFLSVPNHPNATFAWELGSNTSTVSNLPVGIYTVTITISDGCAYTEYVALGDANSVTPQVNITHYTNCANFGDIELTFTDFAANKYSVQFQGPSSKSGNFQTVVPTNPITLAQLSSYPNVEVSILHPGNYAILVVNNQTGKQSALNLRIENQVDCKPQLTTATTAYWGLTQTYHFIKNIFSSNGATIKESGGSTTLIKVPNTEAYTALDPDKTIGITAGNNSVSDIFQNIFNFGEGTNLLQPWVFLDAVGHEYAHFIIAKNEKMEELIKTGETGALIEGFCDIIGCLTEASQSNIDWEIGEKFELQRSLSNPNKSYNPDTYKGTYWFEDIGNTPSFIHKNSTILSHWFYLLSNNGSSTGINDINKAYTVKGIGIEKALNILWKAFKELPSSATFQQACEATIAIADSLYGSCSLEHVSVANAWYAVGVLPAIYSTALIAELN